MDNDGLIISGTDLDAPEFTLLGAMRVLKEADSLELTDMEESIFGHKNISEDELTDLSDTSEASEPATMKFKTSTGYQSPNAFKPKRSEKARRARYTKDFNRQMKKDITEAKKNTVRFMEFNFADEVKIRQGTQARRGNYIAPQQLSEWMDDAPRVAQSADGRDVVYHLPNTLRARAEKRLFESLMFFSKIARIKVTAGADASGRNAASSYVRKDGQVCGIVKLVTGWHPIGHTHEPIVPSNDLVGKSRNFAAGMKLLDEMALVSTRINYGLSLIDEPHFAAHQALQKAVHEAYPHARALNAVDPLIMEGRAIMWNRQTPLHPDRLDPVQSWAVLLVSGEFKGGHLFIPKLRLRLRYLPGDMIFLRGCILPHEVESWEGGQRVSIAHFTHQSLWNEFNLELPI